MELHWYLREKLPGALAHYDRSLALYDPAEYRPLAARFGHDTRVTVLFFRVSALWLPGHPDALLAETDHALNDAREIRQTLMLALAHTSITHIFCGNDATANELLDELMFWRTEKALEPALEQLKIISEEDYAKVKGIANVVRPLHKRLTDKQARL